MFLKAVLGGGAMRLEHWVKYFLFCFVGGSCGAKCSSDALWRLSPSLVLKANTKTLI